MRKNSWSKQFEKSLNSMYGEKLDDWRGLDAYLDDEVDEAGARAAFECLGRTLLEPIIHAHPEAFQSPIENAMFWSLLAASMQSADGVAVAFPQGNEVVIGRTEDSCIDFIRIEPQFPVGKFRADFRVTATARWGFETYKTASYSVLVECDGHDYHERTKDQAKRDKSRDRFLQGAGYQVFRFTGSEIWGSPLKCAREVVEVVCSHVIDAEYQAAQEFLKRSIQDKGGD